MFERAHLLAASLLVSLGSSLLAAEKGFGPDGEIELIPLTAPVSWVTAEDYPTEALRQNQEGKVAMILDIAPDGVPRGCRIDQTSGSAILDQQSCLILMQRARFKPPRDAAGRLVEATFKRNINWQIPQGVDGLSVPVTIKAVADRHECSADIKGQQRRLTAQLCQALIDSVIKSGRPLDGPIMAEFPDAPAYLEPVGS